MLLLNDTHGTLLISLPHLHVPSCFVVHRFGRAATALHVTVRDNDDNDLHVFRSYNTPSLGKAGTFLFLTPEPARLLPLCVYHVTVTLPTLVDIRRLLEDIRHFLPMLIFILCAICFVC